MGRAFSMSKGTRGWEGTIFSLTSQPCHSPFSPPLPFFYWVMEEAADNDSVVRRGLLLFTLTPTHLLYSLHWQIHIREGARLFKLRPLSDSYPTLFVTVCL